MKHSLKSLCVRNMSRPAPIEDTSPAAAKTKGRITMPHHEAAAITSNGEVQSSGESTPETTKSRLEKFMTGFVRGIEYQRCEATLTIDPNRVPSATPMPPKSEPSTMLATKLLAPSDR